MSRYATANLLEQIIATFASYMLMGLSPDHGIHTSPLRYRPCPYRNP